MKPVTAPRPLMTNCSQERSDKCSRDITLGKPCDQGDTKCPREAMQKGGVGGEFRFPPILCVGQRVIPRQEGRWNAVHRVAWRGAVQEDCSCSPLVPTSEDAPTRLGSEVVGSSENDSNLLPQPFV